VWSAKIDSLTRTLAATASGDFTAKLWCVSTGKELYEFKHKHVVKSVDFSSDTCSIATGCQDGYLRIYDTCNPVALPNEYKVATNQDDGITKITWLQGIGKGNETFNKHMILIGKKSGRIELWDTRASPTAPSSSTLITSDDGKTNTIMDIDINGQQNTIVIASGEKVSFLSIHDLSIIKSFNMPKGMSFREEGGASLNSNGTRFIAGGSDLWLREFDANSGDVLQTFKGHHGPIRCVRYHPSETMGVTGSEDATIRLWNLTNNSDP
jgi:serine-threonine kinase receptor-associated protein